MNLTQTHQIKSGFIITAVGIALMITALGMLGKDWLHAMGRKLRVGDVEKFKSAQPVLTVLAGAVLGVLVTLTSIGAGALGTVMLVYLYPLRLNASKLVGTDLAHAIPLALIAGLGHLSLGNVNYSLLLNLLAGSIPGILLGSVISTRAPMTMIRYAIALVLGACRSRCCRSDGAHGPEAPFAVSRRAPSPSIAQGNAPQCRQVQHLHGVARHRDHVAAGEAAHQPGQRFRRDGQLRGDVPLAHRQLHHGGGGFLVHRLALLQQPGRQPGRRVLVHQFMGVLGQPRTSRASRVTRGRHRLG
jgi:hypothetical protein